MAEKNPSILHKKIIFKRFKLGKLINESNFSWVYEGKNIINNIPVAIKIDKMKEYNLLESEAYILTNVKGFGIPEIISFGKCGPFKILIEELLGKDIQTLWESCPFKKDHLGKKNLYIKDISLFAIQAIERLKYIHNKNIIHHDIKPKNFLIGRNDPNTIYLIDFGFAKKYRSSRTGKHIKFTIQKYFIGSLYYSSLNAIKHFESSRRDDLESLGYVLIFLAKGGILPFNNYPGIDKMKNKLKEKIIKKIRLETTDENLCKGLPNEFIDYMKYTKKLNFEQEPDYNYLLGLFQTILSKNEFKKNLTFFWIKQNTPNKERKIFLSERKNRNNLRPNSLNKLYNKIKNSLKNKSITKMKENHTENNMTDNKIEFNSILNTKTNNIKVNSIKNTDNNKEITKINIPNEHKKNIHIKHISALFRTKNNGKRKIYLNNNISNLLKYNSNIIKNDNPKEPINSTFIYNNDKIILCNKNNIYLTNKTNISQNIIVNNTILKNKINESNHLLIKSDTCRMKLNKNIVYKPIFPKNSKMPIKKKLKSNIF